MIVQKHKLEVVVISNNNNGSILNNIIIKIRNNHFNPRCIHTMQITRIYLGGIDMSCWSRFLRCSLQSLYGRRQEKSGSVTKNFASLLLTAILHVCRILRFIPPEGVSFALFIVFFSMQHLCISPIILCSLLFFV